MTLGNDEAAWLKMERQLHLSLKLSYFDLNWALMEYWVIPKKKKTYPF